MTIFNFFIITSLFVSSIVNAMDYEQRKLDEERELKSKIELFRKRKLEWELERKSHEEAMQAIDEEIMRNMKNELKRKEILENVAIRNIKSISIDDAPYKS